METNVKLKVFFSNYTELEKEKLIDNIQNDKTVIFEGIGIAEDAEEDYNLMGDENGKDPD